MNKKTNTSSFDDYNKITASLNKPKISKPIMTKYEYDQIISLRANQLAHGAEAYIDISNLKIKSNMEFRKVALTELKEGKLPYIIKRELPNGKSEYYRLCDLDLVAVQYMMER